MMNGRAAAGALLVAAAVVLAGCTAEPGVADPADTPAASIAALAAPSSPPTYAPVDLLALEAKAGDDTAAADSGVVDVVYLGTIQGEWTRVTEAWPLPVPDDHSFPARVAPIEGDGLYTVGYGLLTAANWWQCAAATTAIQAHETGDEATASYWLEALHLWWANGAALAGYKDTEGYIAQALDPASSGDWSHLIAQSAQSGCGDVLHAGP